MKMPASIDLHMHTTVSDGTDTPEEILQRVKDAGLDFFAVTDHDALKGSKIISGLLKENDPAFITGVEFSCRDEEGKYHILGYAYDPDSEPINKVIEFGHSLRMKKVKARLEFLQNSFGYSFPEEEINNLLALDNPGKPHIGNMMVKYGYAKSIKEAIRESIDKFHFITEFIRPEQAIEAILASGGIPVLAHPFYGSGDQLIIGEAMEYRLEKLKGFGLQGVEAYYSGFTDKLRRQMIEYADRYDLLITAGSDYHGKNKLIPLGDTGLPGPEEYPEKLVKFIETVLQ